MGHALDQVDGVERISRGSEKSFLVCLSVELVFVVFATAEGVVEEDSEGHLFDDYDQIWNSILDVFPGDLLRAVNDAVGGDYIEQNGLEEVQTDNEFE